MCVASGTPSEKARRYDEESQGNVALRERVSHLVLDLEGDGEGNEGTFVKPEAIQLTTYFPDPKSGVARRGSR